MAAYLTAALTIIAFAILPGTWLVFALPLQTLRWHARLALAIALSPALLALQVLLLKACQVPFANIPTILLVANLPALLFIGRAWLRADRPDRPAIGSILGTTGLFTLLMAYLAIPWRLIPGLRTFAWHALWHTDIAYALTRNTLLPEEPELAGIRLSYSWTGHLFWSVTGWLTNLPPTVLYSATNVIWLAVAVTLAYALCRDGLQLPRPLAVLGTGTIFLGTNILGVLAWIYARDWHWHREYFGDLRYTPMLGKYLGFETMPFAFALLIGLTFVGAMALRHQIRQLWILFAALLVALGLLYPILFPAGGIIVGLFWLVAALQNLNVLRCGSALYPWRTLIAVAVGMVLSVIITFGFLQLVTMDGGDAPIHITNMILMKEKGLQGILALLLFAPGLFFLGAAWRRNAPGLLLIISTMGLLALYAVADLEALEYKYVLAATIVAAPIGAAGLGSLVRGNRLRWLTTAGVLLLLMVANQVLMLRVGAQVPTNLVNAPQVDETQFWLQLQPDQPEAGWVDAIREKTPPNTIVVASQSHIHVSPFLSRALYAPSDFDGTAIAGYSVDNRYNLLSWRGYSALLYEERMATIQALQSDGDSAWAAALVKMLTLKRPLALYLQNDEPIVAWLQEQQVGTEIYVTATDSVWLVEPSVATLGQLQITLSNGTRMMHVEVGKPAPMQSSHDVESATTDVSN